MEYYKEEDFYKDSDGPTEHYVYSNYLFWQDSKTEWGQDYDQFVYVKNSRVPYIRKVEKRGSCMSPCGGSSSPATDGYFATKTPQERDQVCPKIAFGIVATFLINLRYDNEQSDFVLMKEASDIMREYYNRFRDNYMATHNGLRYQDLSYEKKELDFIEMHKAQEVEAYKRSQETLKNYSLLYEYSKRFYTDYMSFIEKNKTHLARKTMPTKLRYSIQKASAFETEYLKVYLMDSSEIHKLQTLLSSLSTIRKVNISNSTSADHPGDNLTVYPKSMCTCDEAIEEIMNCLDNYNSNMTYGHQAPDSNVHFEEIEAQILEELDGAQAMIDVCVAWFTNDKLRDKLLKKQQDGVKVRIIIHDDGVNKTKGVDLSHFEHKMLRGEHGGIMHDKFCVIDNVTAITGSYNWTNNAEFKNDENIMIQKYDVVFASKFTRQFNEMWERNDK